MSVLLCTSLRPSPRTRTLCRDLVASSAIFRYHARGKSNMPSLLGYARISGAHRLWLIDSRHGNPSVLTTYNTEDLMPTKVGSIFIKGVALRREISGICPKSTRTRPIALPPPEEDELNDLYLLIRHSFPTIQPHKGPCTELRIRHSTEKKIEVLFIEGETGCICGPKIILGDYRWWIKP
ncbi:MAG: hypothetical protein ACUVQ5_02045 [Candidatus Methanomethylicaceae archaeon]